MNVNKTKYINILHKHKQNKIHRYPYINIIKPNTSISYINCKQNKIHRYPYINVNKTKYTDIPRNVNKTKYTDIPQNVKKIHQYPT